MCRSCVYMVPALIHHCACRWPSTICARPSAGTVLIIKLYIFSPKFLWLLAKRVNFSGSLFAINGFINFLWANERFCIYSSLQVLLSVASSCHCLWCRPGGHFKNTYELLNLRALKYSPVNKIHIFQCMGKIFCVEFQRYPLKFHTKYLTHTLRDTIFIQHWNFKSS